MAQSEKRAIPIAGTSRAEAFSDGVLAIIITLLVLELRPPDVGPGQLLNGLLQQWPSCLAYVTSYMYVYLARWLFLPQAQGYRN